MAVEVPFLPQAQITNQILQGMAQANEEHAQQQANAARQKQLAIAQQEANTASSRLATETPLINAQVNEAQNRARAQALTLAANQRVQDLINGVGAPSEEHIAALVGAQHHPDVALEAPQPDQLTVSNPMGQTLAQPAAPAATAPITPDASQPIAPPDNGSSVTAPVTAPAPTAQPSQGIPGMVAEVARRVGGLTTQEQDATSFAFQQLQLNPTADGLAKFQSDLHAIIQKRNDPTYAAQVAFQRAGLSEPAAVAAAQRNTFVQNALDKLETTPEMLTGDKASSAKAQLADSLRRQI
jgi:hypothetical protein